jgi:hypothetical protein
MIKQHSAIRKLFAAMKSIEEKSVMSRPARFFTRLGDVKVETKMGSYIGDIDGPLATDRYL